MKKFKEFLLLFVPLIILMIFPIVWFVTRKSSFPDFVGNWHYLELAFKDKIFWETTLCTYSKLIIFSILAVIAVALLCRFIKRLQSRKVFYPFSIVLASVFSCVGLYIDQVNVAKDSILPVSLSIYEIISALQAAFFTVLLFWLFEMLFLFIKNRKSVQR